MEAWLSSQIERGPKGCQPPIIDQLIYIKKSYEREMKEIEDKGLDEEALFDIFCDYEDLIEIVDQEIENYEYQEPIDEYLTSLGE